MLLGTILDTPHVPDQWWRRPNALRALAYALVDRVDPLLARAIHPSEAAHPAAERDGRDSVRPFTVSALEGRGRVRVRFTALDEPVACALVAAAASLSPGRAIAFRETTIDVLDWTVDEPPAAGGAHYADLLREPFRPRLALRFPTPTAFNQAGVSLPLPLPDLMLRSWARRWNGFAPPALRVEEEMLASISRRVVLAQHQVESATVDLHPGKVVGFVGTVTLEALRPARWSTAERSTFAALAAYSAFCGTGVRTTQGLGLTLPANAETSKRRPPRAEGRQTS